jgi:hypothetical protein
MAYTIADIIKDEVLGNAEHVNQQEYLDRVAICQKCEHLMTLIPMSRWNL